MAFSPSNSPAFDNRYKKSFNVAPNVSNGELPYACHATLDDFEILISGFTTTMAFQCDSFCLILCSAWMYSKCLEAASIINDNKNNKDQGLA